MIPLAVLYMLLIAVPHPYAGYAVVLFLLLGTGAWFVFQGRWRVLVIAAIGVVIAAGVVVLHVRATQVLTIQNHSGRVVSVLEVIVISDAKGASFVAQNMPAGYEGSLQFLLPGFDGRNITAEGQFADGGKILSLSAMSTVGGTGGHYHRHTVLVLREDGSVEWQFP